MLNKAYVEITNQCNLNCAFCPKTRRPPRRMSTAEFAAVAAALQEYVRFLYLHLMGEPLSHPELGEILTVAGQKGFRVCITTNGTLLGQRGGVLTAHAAVLHKLSVSLHALEGSGAGLSMEAYLESVWSVCSALREQGVHCALRLWNEGGAAERNGEILRFLEEKTGVDPEMLPRTRSRSRVLGKDLFLEQEQVFAWPDKGAAETGAQFCFGLRDQLGVLADGTVVPCCLDHEGDVPLGNLFETPLADILASPRARTLYDGFSRRAPAEELCRRCGFATRFNR
ncbi:SPASM domain-containing protein [bacterium 210917-DFI.7.65]|nr:SPASM domain-containing protein [bacterium 210917-DFI.7.65]